jgi:hypothetical protein
MEGKWQLARQKVDEKVVLLNQLLSDRGDKS